MASVQSPAVSAPTDFVGALLVADTRAFVDAWREVLGANSATPADQLQELSERCKTLQIRASAAGVGGLAHHLAQHAAHTEHTPWDRDRVEECLRNVSELAWQLEQELDLASAHPEQWARSHEEEAREEEAREEEAEAGPATERNLVDAKQGAADLAFGSLIASNLIASSMGAAGAAPPPTTPSPTAWPGWKRVTGSMEASRALSAPEENGADALSRVLGMGPIGDLGSSPAGLAGMLAPAPESEPEPASPILLEPEPHEVGDADDELTDRNLEIRLERVRRPPPYPVLSREIAIELPLPSEVHFYRRSRRMSRWAALAAAAGVVLIALFFTSRQWLRPRSAAEQRALASTRSEALLPANNNGKNPGLTSLVQQLHAYGGVESKELGELLDAEAASVAKALAEPCTPGSLGCRLAEQSQRLLELGALQKAPPRPVTAMGDWLQGLQLPQIGLKDEPRVKRLVEYHTADPVGREMFQGLMFRCGDYQEPFRDVLTQHGLPLDLVAVVMVESGCVLDAESPSGARGLWQLDAGTARAYHLRLQSGAIDERLNAIKATDAALDLLSDLYRKLGSWELALASYQLGPFSLLAQLQRAGQGADFWDLLEAGRLPKESASYVPRVQAFALILANLEHFQFQRAQPKPTTASAALLVPAGTRLGLVARAASSSATRIRELNPELIGDAVPGSLGERLALQVPSDSAPKAHELLDRLIAQADGADECVPLNFDWGRQRFTRAMQDRCKR